MSKHENSKELQEAIELLRPICQRRDLDSLTLLVNLMVCCMVDDPSKAQVSEMRGERNIVFEVKVADADHKFLLGAEEGQNLRAMRRIIICVARKLGVKVDISDVPQSDSAQGRYRNDQERQRHQGGGHRHRG